MNFIHPCWAVYPLNQIHERKDEKEKNSASDFLGRFFRRCQKDLNTSDHLHLISWCTLPLWWVNQTHWFNLPTGGSEKQSRTSTSPLFQRRLDLGFCRRKVYVRSKIRVFRCNMSYLQLAQQFYTYKAFYELHILLQRWMQRSKTVSTLFKGKDGERFPNPSKRK